MTPLRIVVAPNAFKETFSPREAARLIARGLRRALPRARLILLPLADGGDGTLEALRSHYGGRLVSVRVAGPMGDPVRASYLRAGSTAVVEMARASGLKLVPEGRRNPLLASTRGSGELIARAVADGASRVLLGVGGSATVDGGRGAMEVLTPALCRRITILCDVENPLLGPKGAARVFGPQKGATPAMVEVLEKRNAAWARTLPKDVRRVPGTGAAGGLPAPLLAHGAKLVPGAAFIAKLHGFPRPCDVVVTGEGKVDATSLGGKVVGTLLKLSTAPVVVVCGRCELDLPAFETGARTAAALTAAAERAGRWIQERIASGR
ncbi:MAG TPA: glycerate kinase [Planctomycetota bacterium]